MPRGIDSAIENNPTRNRAPVGTDDRAPDGLPSRRLLSNGSGRKARQPGVRRHPPNGHQVDRTLCSPPVAPWPRDQTRSRSGRGGHAPGGVCRRCRSRGTAARDAHDARTPHALAQSSGVRKDVETRLAALGLPSHGSSPSAVRCVRSDGGNGVHNEGTKLTETNEDNDAAVAVYLCVCSAHSLNSAL